MRLRAVVGIVVLGIAAPTRAYAACPASFEEVSGLVIRAVRVTTPLTLNSAPADRFFFGTTAKTLAALETSLPIQPGQRFTLAAFFAGQAQVASVLGLRPLSTRQRVRVAFVVPDVEDCTADTLTVVYRTYSTDAFSHLANVVEFDPATVSRDLAPPAARPGRGRLIAPLFGYDKSRLLFGGSRFAVDTGMPLLSKIGGAFSVAQGGGTADIRASGERSLGAKLLGHAEWQIGYQNANEPIADLDPNLESTTAAARFIGTTQAMKTGLLAFRYGSMFEIGSRQSDPGGPTENYTSIKAYVGANIGAGRARGSVSYGVEAAKDPDARKIGYVKQVIDLELTKRWLPRAHVPLQLDVAVNAGWIQSMSSVPAAERFYGGNTPPTFLDTDSWKIAEGPRLRSFPQHGFHRAGADETFGATRFASANVTFAPTIWHYPAVPDDILDDPRLGSALAFQLRSTKEVFVDDCGIQTLEFAALANHVTGFAQTLRDATAWRARLHAMPLPDPVTSALSDVDDASDKLRAAIDAITARPPTGSAFSPARVMASSDEDTSSLLQAAVASESLADALEENGLADEAVPVRHSATAFRNHSSAIQAAFAPLAALNAANPASYATVITALPTFRVALETLDARLTAIPDPPDEGTASLLETARTQLEDTLRKLAAVETAAPSELYDELESLTTNWGGAAPSSPRALTDAVRRLRSSVPSADAVQLDGPLQEFEREFARVTAALNTIPRPPLQSCAFAESAFAVRIVEAAFRELNVFQVSPVWILDAARMSSAGDTSGTRVGTGPGIRLSVATLDVTLTYAFNLRRRSDEPRGGLFLQISVTDLFR